MNTHQTQAVLNCRYPETRVPLTIVYRRSTHAAILSRVIKKLYVGPGHDSPQPRATTLGQQQRLTPPHGQVRGCHVSRESNILQDINSESGPPWESAGPLDIQFRPLSLVQDPTCTDQTPRMGSGPLPYGVWAAHSRVPRFQDRTHPDLNQGPGGGPVPTRV
jgi:hypothetical protein